MTLEDDLSRLLAGDLGPEEAAALRERIATEPEVAELWAELQLLVEDLQALPQEHEPPVFRGEEAAEWSPPRWRSAMPWMAAAAALWVAWMWTGTPPERLLLSGSEWVDGHGLVVAGDTKVEVRGQALISVEPAGGVLRVPGPNLEDPMNKNTLIAGLAGAAVTVAVYEGVAIVYSGANAAPVTVRAGESLRPTAAPTPPPARVAPAPAGEPASHTIDRLTRELEEARRELAEAEFTGAMARGQLVAMQGEPSQWPAGVPGPMTAAQFEGELRAQIADLEGAELVRVDCGEYPCVAAIQYLGDFEDEAWSQKLGKAVGGWASEVLGEDSLSISTNTSRFRSGDHEARYVIFGAHTEGRESSVGVRTEHRIDAVVDDLGQELAEQHPE